MEEVSALFQNVLDLCPDFYDIGIKMRALYEFKSDSTSAMFLGELNEEITDLYLPDQKGFVYYNNALDDLPIIFNTKATILVTPDFCNFVSYEEVSGMGLTNITGKSDVQGRGLVKWIILDNEGKRHTVLVTAYFVPTAKVRLFSVQSYLGHQKGRFVLEGASALFKFQDNAKLTFKTYDIDSERTVLPLA